LKKSALAGRLNEYASLATPSVSPAYNQSVWRSSAIIASGREGGMKNRLNRWVGLVLAIMLTWFIFGALWWAPLIFAESYRLLGSELPAATYWIVVAAAKGLPLAAAALSTPIIVWRFANPDLRQARILTGLAIFAALWAAIALCAMALPLQKCGFHWPDFPWQESLSSPSSTCQLSD
jgi:hypothetical protein